MVFGVRGPTPWDNFGVVNMVPSICSQGEGISFLSVGSLDNYLAWVVTTNGKMVTFRKNYDGIDDVLEWVADYSLVPRGSLFSSNVPAAVFWSRSNSYPSGLVAFKGEGVYKLRACGDGEACKTHRSNEFLGCRIGYFKSSEPDTCSECDSTCADCLSFDTNCLECSPIYQSTSTFTIASNTVHNCECKAQYLTSPTSGCCDRLAGEI
jgi:hypothetical protein